ncbi:hypothetical protein M3580_04255 [Bacillus safensis]|uniref:hypothetical protein n=1 Tax=Bacillus safensis TaxID=561879 RepID=UPI002040AE9C|nr:hypothetical protein [Bacillus safensis]MCM2988439.1 hypothetical protein [Bacillus safensis]
MKKFVMFFVSLLSLLLLPINVKSYSPYDIITKDGGEIPFSEYKTKVEKKDLSHQEGTPPITATTLIESNITDFIPSKLKPEKVYDKN